MQAWSPTNGRKARREGVHIPRNLCLDWRGGCHERACVVHDGSLEPQDGINYVIGVDLGLKKDRTAVAVCHSERLRSDEDPTVGARVVLDGMQVWKGSRLRPVQLDDIEEWIAAASARYNRAAVVLDPWQAAGLT